MASSSESPSSPMIRSASRSNSSAWEGKVLEAGNEVIILQSTEDELKTEVIAKKKVPDQFLGYHWVDTRVTNGRITGLIDNDQRLSITMPHTADFDYRTVQVMLFDLFL